MKIGGKEILAILAILIIIAMSFQGSQESQVIVLDRQPEYIPTPVFIGGGPSFPPHRPPRPRPRPRPPRRRRPKIIPIKPPKIPKIPVIPIKPIKPIKINKDLVPGGGGGGGYPGDPYPGL